MADGGEGEGVMEKMREGTRLAMLRQVDERLAAIASKELGDLPSQGREIAPQIGRVAMELRIVIEVLRDIVTGGFEL